MVKWTLENAPRLMIMVFVGITVLGSIAAALWAGILTQFAAIGALSNFTFSALVGASATSLTVILLSVVLLSAIMAAVGYKIYSGRSLR